MEYFLGGGQDDCPLLSLKCTVRGDWPCRGSSEVTEAPSLPACCSAGLDSHRGSRAGFPKKRELGRLSVNYVDCQPARCHGWDCKLCLLEEREKGKEKNKFIPCRPSMSDSLKPTMQLAYHSLQLRKGVWKHFLCEKISGESLERRREAGSPPGKRPWGFVTPKSQ